MKHGEWQHAGEWRHADPVAAHFSQHTQQTLPFPTVKVVDHVGSGSLLCVWESMEMAEGSLLT